MHHLFGLTSFPMPRSPAVVRPSISEPIVTWPFSTRSVFMASVPYGMMPNGAPASRPASPHPGLRTRARDLAGEAVALEAGNDAAGHRVVGGDDALDPAAELGVQTVEGNAGLLGVPETGLVGRQDLDLGVGLELVVVALLEQRGIVVGRVAVDVDDAGALRLGTQALLEAGPHEAADLHVVERHVVRRAATEGEAVVVNALDTSLGGLTEARPTGV